MVVISGPPEGHQRPQSLRQVVILCIVYCNPQVCVLALTVVLQLIPHSCVYIAWTDDEYVNKLFHINFHQLSCDWVVISIDDEMPPFAVTFCFPETET